VDKIPNDLIRFYKNNKDLKQYNPQDYIEALNRDDFAYFKVNKIFFDSQKVLNECFKNDDLFILHKNIHSQYTHNGWSHLTLYGLNDQKEHDWRSIIKNFPYTFNFLKSLPYHKFNKIRITRLEPQGFITPHIDQEIKMFNILNIAINNPKDCHYVFKNFGEVPFKDESSFLLDISKEHCLINLSNQNCYHIVIDGIINKFFLL
jgi:hypothetical protein